MVVPRMADDMAYHSRLVCGEHTVTASKARVLLFGLCQNRIAVLILYRQSKEWPRSLDAMEGGSKLSLVSLAM